MSRSPVVLKCDCGCRKRADAYETDRWLTLTQQPERMRTSEPKLREKELHFASIRCLHKWASGALKVIPEMEKSADALWPRGEFYTDEFPTLWF